MEQQQRKLQIDWRVFWPALIVVLGVSLPLAINPEKGGTVVNAALAFCTGKFGWLFLLFGMFCFVLLMWLAFGRYGNVKMGGPTDEPEFSYFSWIAMLFCAGIGSGIMIWSVIEPIYYLAGPPLNVEAGTFMAKEWAHVYGQFHWGFSAWAIYCLPTIPIAYYVYVRKENSLKMSVTFKDLFGPKVVDSWIGVVIDVIVMFGLIGAVGTSLGLAVPVVSALFHEMFGIPQGMGLNLLIIALWTAMFGTSVFKGLSKGIKVLSDINIYLAIILAVFVLFVGPTVFTMKLWTNSMGLLFSNFFHMSFWMDPINQGGFPEGWTVFYWAWWIAYTPMMGLFVARISRGRTIKDIVIAECLWGTLGCWLFFGVIGAYSIYVDINGIVPVSQILADQGSQAAIVAVMGSLPLGKLVMFVYLTLIFIFLATTLDSSAYTLASVCTRDIRGDEQPATWNRVFWALCIGLISIGLLAVGGLGPVQTSSIVSALPLMPVLFLQVISFMKAINKDFAHLKPRPIAIDYQPEASSQVSQSSNISA
ncbi:BCCT family transporter [Candidatus Formimonas warabiya]|uniref:Choline transporter n=1 Tax=Formimonas warabiya TaxID=1761012 RepID=A0A3G1KXP6_FORW1|nr:BCCT family transporter [Candidatus Formimonas warabiya]ATW27254.1 choline transporter [Candidatus Formimonas warabiya]